MTARRIIFWLLLLPLTALVWAQVLFGYPDFRTNEPVRIQSVQLVTWPPPKEPNVWRYTVCAIAGAENCWETSGTRPVICSSQPQCWRDGKLCADGALCRRTTTDW
jgi:hypothetical protein